MLQTGGVCAIDCGVLADKIMVGLLILRGDKTGQCSLVDSETSIRYEVWIPDWSGYETDVELARLSPDT